MLSTSTYSDLSLPCFAFFQDAKRLFLFHLFLIIKERKSSALLIDLWVMQTLRIFLLACVQFSLEHTLV